MENNDMPSNATTSTAHLVQLVMVHPTCIRRLVAVVMGKVRYNPTRKMYVFITANTPMVNGKGVDYYSHNIADNVPMHVAEFPNVEVTPQMWSEIAKWGYYEEIETLDISAVPATTHLVEHNKVVEKTIPDIVKPPPIDRQQQPVVSTKDLEVSVTDEMIQDLFARAGQAKMVAGTQTGVPVSTGFKISILNNHMAPGEDVGGLGEVPQLAEEVDSTRERAE